jgi:hypothetical protein
MLRHAVPLHFVWVGGLVAAGFGRARRSRTVNVSLGGTPKVCATGGWPSVLL